MTKQGGLGDNLYVAGYNLSGDINSLGRIGGGPATLEVTGIDKSAFERIGGVRDGGIEFVSYFNKAVDRAHLLLNDLPSTDVNLTYCRGTSLGSPGACLVAKQINYDGTRAADGAFTFAVNAQANGFGIEWGRQLTAGIETQTSLITGANSTFEGGIGTWVLNLNSTIAATSAQAHGGTGALAVTTTNTSNASAKHTTNGVDGFAATPGRDYLVQGWGRSATVSRSLINTINWYTSGGVFITTSSGSGTTSSTSAWSVLKNRYTAPATAAFGQVNCQVFTPAGAGEVHYFDDITVTAMPASVDFTASTAFGLQAYLQVTAFTGTDATIRIQESSDDGVADTYANVTSGSFTSVTTGPSTQRLITSATQTVERYLRVVVDTTGGFSNLNFNLVVIKNDTAVTF